jgi:hypothetical protein
MGDLPWVGGRLRKPCGANIFAGVQCLQKFRGRLFAQAAVFYVSITSARATRFWFGATS